MLRLNWKELNPVVNHAIYYKCQPGFQFGPRIISDQHQFIYVAKGKGTANIQGRIYEADEHDLFYYGPQICHSFHADQDAPFEILGLHFDLIGSLEDSRQPAIEIKADFSDSGRENVLFIGERGLDELKVSDRININKSGINELFLQITHYYRKNNSMSATVNRSLLLYSFSLLHKHISNMAEHLSPQMKTLYHLRTRLKQFAEQPYSRNWLKDNTGYNEDYLSRNFRGQFGLSPHEYHLIQKIEKAKDLLEHTDDSVTLISGKLHFNSVHYFCRVFRMHTGQTPLQYRKIREIF